MENAEKQGTIDQREFARIEVSFHARLQPLDEERAEKLRNLLRTRPSVWTPTNESALRDLANSGQTGPEAMLAEAILELGTQIVRLRSRVLDETAPVKSATILQLSGGGGKLLCDLPMSNGDLFEIVFQDCDDGVPPIRALGQIVHARDGSSGYGFRYESIHRRDQQLLMRLIYQIQRQALRDQRLGDA